MRGDEVLSSVLNSEESTLYILCGYPYAGKTYLAKQMLEHYELEYVSIDNIFHEHGFEWDTNVLPTTVQWEQIFKESYKLTKQELMAGKNVLYDSTNQTVASRETLREIANDVGAGTYVLFVKSSVETIWQRWEDNQRHPVRSVVEKSLVQMTIDMFEEPTKEENVIIIRTDDPL